MLVTLPRWPFLLRIPYPVQIDVQVVSIYGLVLWCFPEPSCWVMIERLSCYQVTSMGENDDGTDWKVGIYLGMRHNNSFVLQFPAMIPPLLLLFAFLPPNIISARYGKKPEKVNFRVSKWKIVSCIRMQGKFFHFFCPIVYRFFACNK